MDFTKLIDNFANMFTADAARAAKAGHQRLQDLIGIDYPSFSAILPYRYFCPQQQLFINEHSLGFGLELTVFSGADEKLVNSLADLLRYRIGEEIDLQFILWGSNQVGELIDAAYTHQFKRGEIHAHLAQAALDYYKQAARDGFINKAQLPLALREYRLFAFISHNTAYSDQAVRAMEIMRDNFTVELNSMGISYVPIDLARFLTLMRTWLNPNTKDIYPATSRHEPYSTLNEQVVDKTFELIHEPERLTINTQAAAIANPEVVTKITNLSWRSLPEEFALWQSPDNFFNVFRASQAIRCPFLISMHARLIPQAEAKTTAQNRYLEMEKKAKSAYAKYIAGTQETAAEWKKIRDELASDTIHLAQVYFNLMLFSAPGEEKKDESAAIACYRYNNVELFNTKYLQLQSFLASLPFMCSEGMFHDLKVAGRLKTLTTWNLANLLPVVADFKLCRQGVLLSSFRNQTCFFDMYNERLPISNFNIAVAATSGAGKSFLVQNILSYVLSVQGRCFVVDLGHSYRKFCEIIGGTYLEYDSLRLNPFANVRDINESSEQIRDLLAVLAAPSGALDEVSEEYLRQAIVKAWEHNHNQTNIDDIITVLAELNSKRQDLRLDDLIVLLTRYSTTGPYPNIFNSYSAIAPDADFVVLELGELENKPDLLKAVLFALILNIEEQMYHSPRNQPKMVVIDEAWRLLSGDNKAAARFIEKGYRTARRHHGSFVTITQSIEDFQKSDEAKACWNCSDIKIIMLQNAKAFDDFMLAHPNYFDPYVVALIRQFKEAKNNGFSEFMLQTGKVQSFYRLFVDPFARVMFSSAGKEFAAVKAYQEQGLSITESIMRVAKENYPEEFNAC